MKTEILQLESEMWRCAKAGDKAGFEQIVADNAIMVCGGYRCTGAEYAEFIGDFGIADFEITAFEIVCQTEETVQVHYVVKTTASAPENADLAGLFHVTSTWKKSENEWRLVFNMDSRIVGK